MTNDILSARGVRAFMPAITRPFSNKRAAAVLRRLWRGYWDYQARRATAVMLYALDDRTLANLGIDRKSTPSTRSASCAPARARTTH